MNKENLAAFSILFAKMTDEEKELMEKFRFGYIFFKAQLFLKIGPDKYRKDDAFQQPPIDFNSEDIEVLNDGCRQILNGVGLIPEKAFTNLDVSGFSALFRMFHFSSTSRETKYGFILNGKKGVLDQITFQHLMDGSVVTYYNFCEYQFD